MHLRILPLTPEVEEMYASHATYYEGDAGMDLFVVADQTIAAGATAVIPLGIKTGATRNDRGASWLMMPRSSISKTPLRLCNSIGLIDAGYRGEILVSVDNIKTYDYMVKKGDRIVQAVSFTGEEVSFEIVDSLDITQRGDKGFGSTTEKTETTEAVDCGETKQHGEGEVLNGGDRHRRPVGKDSDKVADVAAKEAQSGGGEKRVIMAEDKENKAELLGEREAKKPKVSPAGVEV